MRVKNNIDSEWLFRLENEEERKVNLPHDWSIEYPFDKTADTCGSGGYVIAGVGHYKKIIYITDEYKDKKILIHFDGVYMNCRVYINGEYIGKHIYGYTPFSFDISNNVILGENNIIEVTVDNSKQPGSRWYSGSGITRSVWLEYLGNVHIDENSVFATTKNEDGGAIIDINALITIPDGQIINEKSYNLDVEICKDEVLIESKKISIRDEKDVSIKTSIAVKNPRLWSDINPDLYKLELKLYKDNILIDSVNKNIGIRDIMFDPQHGFFLNGVSTKINGVCLHHDAGCLGAAVPPKVWKRRLKELKEMGVNAIRCSHNPPDSALLDLCDEMGIMVMDEAFDEWRILKGKELGSNTHESKGYSEWFDLCHEQDLKDMIVRDRNHPSIIMWSIGNEIPEQVVEGGEKLALHLKGICKQLDPTRPITLANDQIEAEPNKAREEFLDTLDVVGYNYVARWRDRAETLYDTDVIKKPNRCVIGSENPSAGGVRGEYLLESNGSFWSRPYFSIPVGVSKLLKYTMTHDYVAGDFMWTGVDYLGESFWPSHGASCGVLDTAGFRKDNYYLYKSIWNNTPMIYGYPHWNYRFKRGTIIPVICYTNCEYAELFLNGKSYGKKSMSYPEYGMTQTYGHFDTYKYPSTTNDLFLQWDVPYDEGKVEIIGYIQDKEICRYVMETVGESSDFVVECDEKNLQADNKDIAHIEISIVDAMKRFVPTAKQKVTVTVSGCGKLIGIDNGDLTVEESYKGNTMHTFNGKLLAIIQSSNEAGEIEISIDVENLGTKKIILIAR